MNQSTTLYKKPSFLQKAWSSIYFIIFQIKATKNPAIRLYRDADQPPDLDEIFAKFLQKFKNKGQTPQGSEPGNSSPLGIPLKLVLIPLVLFLLFLFVYKSIYVINPSERGVVFFLGKYNGPLLNTSNIQAVSFLNNESLKKGTKSATDTTSKEAPLVIATNSLLLPGLHLKLWPLYQVDKINVKQVRVQNVEGRMLTKDENFIEAIVSIQYRIIQPELYTIYLANPQDSVVDALTSALRHVEGSSNLEDSLTTGREKIAAEVGQRLQTYLNLYHSGIQVIKVSLQDSSAPKEVQEAFDDVNRAREDAARSINEARSYTNAILPEARGKSAKMIAHAEAYKAKVLAESQGESQRFTKVSEQFRRSPETLSIRLKEEAKLKIYQSTTKILIDPSVKNFVYLPLDQLMDSTKGIHSKNDTQILQSAAKVASVEDDKGEGKSSKSSKESQSSRKSTRRSRNGNLIQP